MWLPVLRIKKKSKLLQPNLILSFDFTFSCPHFASWSLLCSVCIQVHSAAGCCGCVLITNKAINRTICAVKASQTLLISKHYCGIMKLAVWVEKKTAWVLSSLVVFICQEITSYSEQYSDRSPHQNKPTEPHIYFSVLGSISNQILVYMACHNLNILLGSSVV